MSCDDPFYRNTSLAVLAVALAALRLAAMASDVIHKYVSQTSYIEVNDPAVTADVDDPEAYAGLLAQHP